MHQVTKVIPNLYSRLVISSITGLSIHLLSASTNGLSDGPIFCPFRLLTGVNCPTCGTTRALGALAEGHLRQSINLNPLAIMLVLIASIWTINPKIIVSISQRVSKEINGLKPLAIWLIFATAYIALWVWNFWRITPNYLS